MRLRLDRLLKSQEIDIYIRRGKGCPGYTLALDSNGDPQKFSALVNIRPNRMAEFAQYYSTLNPETEFLFNPTIKPNFGDGNNELIKDDEIIIDSERTVTPPKPSETAQENLIRDLKDTISGVNTILYTIRALDNEVVYSSREPSQLPT